MEWTTKNKQYKPNSENTVNKRSQAQGTYLHNSLINYSRKINQLHLIWKTQVISYDDRGESMRKF